MAGIPRFPDYAPIDASLQREISDFTRGYSPYSDFNFVNLFSWNLANDASATLLHGNLAVRLPDYIDGQPFYSFLGDTEVESTASTLLDEAQRYTSVRRLRLVPGVGALALKESGKFTVTEDTDGHDYIVSLTDTVTRQGARYRHMRQELNFFNTNYGLSTTFLELDLTDPGIQGSIFQVFLGRESSKQERNHENIYESELMALGRLFGLADLSALRTFGCKIGNELKAFIICEKIDDAWCTGHFWKADTAYRGIYRYLMCEVAAQLSAEGFVSLNIEQDLGIAGLKRMKQLFKPVGLLKKYTVTDRF